MAGSRQVKKKFVAEKESKNLFRKEVPFYISLIAVLASSVAIYFFFPANKAALKKEVLLLSVRVGHARDK